MSDLERFQQKRQQNLNFINELITNHKINFDDEKINRTVSPRQQSISSSNMTDQIIAMFNHRQKESIKSPPKILQESAQFSSAVSSDPPDESKEADGIINEIDSVLDRIKNKYNINYSLNDLKDQMNIQLEEDKPQEIFTQQQEQFFPQRKKNDFIYIKQELNLPKKQGLPPKISQDKPLPKRVQQIESSYNEEQIFQQQEYQSPQFHTAEFFFNQQEKKQQNFSLKQQLHQLKKTYKDQKPQQEKKPSFDLEDIEPYVEQISQSQEVQEKHIEKKLTFTDEDENLSEKKIENEIDFQSFQTPQKSYLEQESNLSYSQSAISDRQINFSKVKSSQISLDEAIRQDKLLQQLVDEENNLLKELEQLKLRLNQLEQN